jgi:hypothetical protein
VEHKLKKLCNILNSENCLDYAKYFFGLMIES